MTTDIALGDRYQIEELLSQKAGRRTFLAKDRHSQVPVIIKLLRFGDGFEQLWGFRAIKTRPYSNSPIPRSRSIRNHLERIKM